MSTEIRVFSLNCWGIPVISRNRHARMKALANVLLTGRYDLIALQETWSRKDYIRIKQIIATVLPYSHYFYSGVLGSGMCVFSKYPFCDVFFHPWPLNGYMHKIQHADWFGGKGIGLCRLMIDGLKVNFYTIHMHAEYDVICDEYLAHRVLQAYDAAQFIRLTSESCDLSILVGDFNTRPTDICYKIICLSAQLIDSAEHDHDERCGTYDCWHNSYSSKDAKKDQSHGMRLDYVLYKAAQNVKVNEVQYRNPLPERVPDSDFSFSDHEAVAADISVSKKDGGAVIIPSMSEYPSEYIDVLEESLQIFEGAIAKLGRVRCVYWIVSVVLFAIVLGILIITPPYNLDIVFRLILVFVFALMVFCIFMATLWNSIEFSGIQAAKLRVEIVYNNVKTNMPKENGPLSTKENNVGNNNENSKEIHKDDVDDILDENTVVG